MAHWIVERVEVGPRGGPAWRAACGPYYEEARFAHGGGKACRGCEREKRAGRRAARIEANLQIIRAMHAQAADD